MLLQRPLSRRDAHLELFGRSSTCVRYVADQGGHSPLGFVPFHLIKFDRFQPSLVLTAYCRQAVISAAYPFRNAFGVQRVCASFMGLLDSVISAPMGRLTANHSKTTVFRGFRAIRYAGCGPDDVQLRLDSSRLSGPPIVRKPLVNDHKRVYRYLWVKLSRSRLVARKWDERPES